MGKWEAKREREVVDVTEYSHLAGGSGSSIVVETFEGKMDRLERQWSVRPDGRNIRNQKCGRRA